MVSLCRWPTLVPVWEAIGRPQNSSSISGKMIRAAASISAR